LSTTGTIEENPSSSGAPEGSSEQDHSHDGHDHDHDHDHQHGPLLNPECTRQVVIDVPAEEVSKTWRSVTANYKKYAKIPGFRPGKVPEAVVRRRFQEQIRKEVIDTLLPERFNKEVMAQGLRPVGQPNVTELTIEDGAPLHVKAVFEYLPEFSIEGYQSVTVPKPSSEVTQDEFKNEIEQLRDSRATIEPVEDERPLADGDWAQISYSGNIVGDEAAEPILGEDALVEIGGKETVDAFTTALRGQKPGQELKVEVVYPAEYNEPRLAGKTVAYELEVKAIKKRTMPDLNDELAKEIGGFETWAELETRIRENLAARKSRSVEAETRERLMVALSERFTFPIPESLVQDQIDTRLDRGLRALAAQGMAPEQMRKLDFARLRTAQRDGALAEVKANLLLDRIAKEEDISVSEEELERELQIAALQSREPIDALKSRLTEDGGMARIREQLRREKTASSLYQRLPV
jgi:trigger factor